MTAQILRAYDGEEITPREDVIDVLETLLARAKAGQVVALSYACVRPDGTTGTGYCSGLHGLALVASTAILAHRIAAEWSS